MLLAGLGALAPACGSGTTTTSTTATASTATTVDAPAPTATATAADVDRAVAAGAASVAPQLGSIDVASASLFDYLYRNWGVEGLSGARPQAEQRAAAGGLVDDEALLERLVLADAPPPGIPTDTEPTTAVLADALHCDRRPVDGDRLAALAAGGGYDTTHAALALGWMQELGCPVPAELRGRVVDRMADELAGAADGPGDRPGGGAERHAGLPGGGGPGPGRVGRSAAGGAAPRRRLERGRPAVVLAPDPAGHVDPGGPVGPGKRRTGGGGGVLNGDRTAGTVNRVHAGADEVPDGDE